MHDVAIKKIYLKNVNGCIGCEYCHHHDHICAIKDDMQNYYLLFNEADLIILASPLYFWSISGRLKSFIDRLYAISTDDSYPDKDMMLIMTSGDNQQYTFDLPIAYYQKITEVFGNHNKGILCLGDSEHITYPNKEAIALGQSY